MLPAPYYQLQQELATFLPTERLIVDPLRLLAWGTDASFYRLVPKLLVVVDDEAELRRVLACCARLGTPVTFRAAGTSLSGQAISDSVLIMLGDGWRGIEVAADGASITLQPGVIGAAANRRLAPLGRKIGPDPASIDAAMIGGIAANNASGMCCGTAQNSYNTLAGLRIVLRRRHGARHARRGEPGRVREAAARARRGPRRAGAGDARGRDARRAHPPQVPAQEHDRLQPERAGRLHRSGRHPRPPDDRLGRNARLHQRDHLPDRRGARPQGERADPVRPARDRVQRRDAPEADARRRGRAARPRVAALGGGQARHARGAARAARGRRGPAGRDARGDGGSARRQDRRDRHRARRLRSVRAAALRDRPGGGGGAVERAQGHVPGGRRDATHRNDRDHRGRRVPDRTARRSDARPAEAAPRARLPRGDHLRPRARRQPPLRLHAGLRQRGRDRALPPLHGRDVRDGGREIRRLAEGRARHRTQRRPVRRAGMGCAGGRGDASHQGAVRPEGPAQSRA